MLAAVIVLSAIVIPVNSTIDVIIEYREGKNVFGFSWIC